MAFHPEFARNGKFYTVHTETAAALTRRTRDLAPQAKTLYHGIITEWTADDPKAPVFHGTRRELRTWTALKLAMDFTVGVTT